MLRGNGILGKMVHRHSKIEQACAIEQDNPVINKTSRKTRVPQIVSHNTEPVAKSQCLKI